MKITQNVSNDDTEYPVDFGRFNSFHDEAGQQLSSVLSVRKVPTARQRKLLTYIISFFHSMFIQYFNKNLQY